jgi:hypothetical protein
MSRELRGTTKKNAMTFSIDDIETLRRDLAQLPSNRPTNVNKHGEVAALVSERGRRAGAVGGSAVAVAADGSFPGMMRIPRGWRLWPAGPENRRAAVRTGNPS